MPGDRDTFSLRFRTIPSPLIYNSSLDLRTPRAQQILQTSPCVLAHPRNHLSPIESHERKRTNVSFHGEAQQRKPIVPANEFPSKTERKKKGAVSVVLRDRRGGKRSKRNGIKRPCRKSVANSCRPKRIREKRRGGPGIVASLRINARRHWWPPWKFWKTILAAFTRDDREREREEKGGEHIPKRRFSSLSRPSGGPLARALGSALNGHKWQTNTAVGSASTKVETSRARPRRPTFVAHALLRPSFRPLPFPSIFPPDCRCRGLERTSEILWNLEHLGIVAATTMRYKDRVLPLWLEFT